MCMYVCIYVGARSEALASAQLELHGLQDMLEGLTSWIVEAEARMSESEAMPIGSDIETVERQLADHEVCVYTYIIIMHTYIHVYMHTCTCVCTTHVCMDTHA